MEKNGYVRWPHLVGSFLTLLGIFVGVAMAYTNSISTGNVKIIDRMEKYSDCVHSIDLRLSRIEERLGI